MEILSYNEFLKKVSKDVGLKYSLYESKSGEIYLRGTPMSANPHSPEYENFTNLYKLLDVFASDLSLSDYVKHILSIVEVKEDVDVTPYYGDVSGSVWQEISLEKLYTKLVEFNYIKEVDLEDKMSLMTLRNKI